MKHRVVTPPAVEPVSLAEIKEQLGVTLALDDAMLARKARAAREYVERFIGQPLLVTVFDGYLDRFPPREIRLPVGPPRGVSAVAWHDPDGVERILDEAGYLVDDVNDPGQILLAPGRSWPAVAARPNAVRVRFGAGLAATPEDVPDTLREAVLQLAAWWYEQREAAIADMGAREIPFGVAELLREHRGWSFG